jgi:hypothetical protein
MSIKANTERYDKTQTKFIEMQKWAIQNKNNIENAALFLFVIVCPVVAFVAWGQLLASVITKYHLTIPLLIQECRLAWIHPFAIASLRTWTAALFYVGFPLTCMATIIQLIRVDYKKDLKKLLAVPFIPWVFLFAWVVLSILIKVLSSVL